MERERKKSSHRRRAFESIYALVIASLMVPAVPLALMADRALAAEMPKDFQGTWCTSSDTLKDWGAYNPDGADCLPGQLQFCRDHCDGGEKPRPLHVLHSSQSHQIRCLPLGEDLSKPGAGAGSKAIPNKPVESRLSHRAPMHWRSQAVGDDRDRLGDRKGIHQRGCAARLSVPVG